MSARVLTGLRALYVRRQANPLSWRTGQWLGNSREWKLPEQWRAWILFQIGTWSAHWEVALWDWVVVQERRRNGMMFWTFQFDVAFEVGGVPEIPGLLHPRPPACTPVSMANPIRLVAFESMVTDFAHPVKWKRPPKAIDGRGRLLQWAWWVYKVQVVLWEHGRTYISSMLREFDPICYAPKSTWTSRWSIVQPHTQMIVRRLVWMMRPWAWRRVVKKRAKDPSRGPRSMRPYCQNWTVCIIFIYCIPLA